MRDAGAGSESRGPVYSPTDVCTIRRFRLPLFKVSQCQSCRGVIRKRVLGKRRSHDFGEEPDGWGCGGKGGAGYGALVDWGDQEWVFRN